MDIVCAVLLFSIIVFTLLPKMRQILEKAKSDIHLMVNQNIDLNKLANQSFYFRLVKRFFDVIISGIVIYILSPVFLVSCIFLKIEKPGPLFRSREIIGYRGKKIKKLYFNIYEEPQSDKMSQLGRILYKTGLYAFPSIFQVFTGKITLVGLSSVDLDKYDNNYKILYDYCKPGFISLAKVAGSNNNYTIFYDIYYLKSINAILDLIIFIGGSMIISGGDK
jgi:undecaprenyl-phosphate galactose phosphotransferase